MKSKSNNIENETNNWNLAILTFVILIFLFFWFYSFLFITDPTKLQVPINADFLSSTTN